MSGLRYKWQRLTCCQTFGKWILTTCVFHDLNSNTLPCTSKTNGLSIWRTIAVVPEKRFLEKNNKLKLCYTSTLAKSTLNIYFIHFLIKFYYVCKPFYQINSVSLLFILNTSNDHGLIHILLCTPHHFSYDTYRYTFLQWIPSTLICSVSTVPTSIPRVPMI